MSAVRLIELPEATFSTLTEYNKSAKPLSFANLWDNAAGRQAKGYQDPVISSYRTVVKGGYKPAESKEITITVWPNVFFTRYSVQSGGYDMLPQPDPNPNEPIVVTINTATKDAKINLSVSPTNTTTIWGKATKLDKPDWVVDHDSENMKSYSIKTSNKAEKFFVRCKAKIIDPESPRHASFAYSRVFKVVIKVKKMNYSRLST